MNNIEPNITLESLRSYVNSKKPFSKPATDEELQRAISHTVVRSLKAEKQFSDSHAHGEAFIRIMLNRIDDEAHLLAARAHLLVEPKVNKVLAESLVALQAFQEATGTKVML